MRCVLVPWRCFANDKSEIRNLGLSRAGVPVCKEYFKYRCTNIGFRSIFKPRPYTDNRRKGSCRSNLSACWTPKSSNRKASPKKRRSDLTRGKVYCKGTGCHPFVVYGRGVVRRYPADILPQCRSRIRSVVYNVIEQVILDLRQRDNMRQAVDAPRAKILDTDAAVKGSVKMLLVSKPIMASTGSLVRLETETEIEYRTYIIMFMWKESIGRVQTFN